MNSTVCISWLAAFAALSPAQADALPSPARDFTCMPASQLNRELPQWPRFSGEDRLRLEGFRAADFSPMRATRRRRCKTPSRGASTDRARGKPEIEKKGLGLK